MAVGIMKGVATEAELAWMKGWDYRPVLVTEESEKCRELSGMMKPWILSIESNRTSEPRWLLEQAECHPGISTQHGRSLVHSNTGDP